MKEVSLFLNKGVPEPYNSYIIGRNTEVGKHIAHFTGRVFTANYAYENSQVLAESAYFVPSKTLDQALAQRLWRENS